MGNGSRAKLAVNLILGLNRAALAEGLALASGLGLDRVAFLEVARGSAAYSQVMDVKGELMARREYRNPQSRVDQSLKDFKLMLEQAHAQVRNCRSRRFTRACSKTASPTAKRIGTTRRSQKRSRGGASPGCKRFLREARSRPQERRTPTAPT